MIGRGPCAACEGVGMRLAPASWSVCGACGGLGHVWNPGGPAFGAALVLSDRAPGELLELGTGDRVRVRWHSPRTAPSATYVALVDEWTDEEGRDPVLIDSRIGVARILAEAGGGVRGELHDGEKDADAVDPFARRARAGGGLL